MRYRSPRNPGRLLGRPPGELDTAIEAEARRTAERERAEVIAEFEAGDMPVIGEGLSDDD